MKQEHKSTEKEKYESPEMEIVKIDAADIIFSSGSACGE